MRCINCGLCVKRFKRHVIRELSIELQHILKEWLALSKHQSDSVICNACFNILNESPNEANPTRQFGHIHICIGCGCSVLGKRSHTLQDNSPLLKVFLSTNTMQVVRNLLCHTCWSRGNRRVGQDKQRATVKRSSTDQIAPPLLSTSLGQVIEPQVLPSMSIVLPNYKRAANTSRRCIYYTCNNMAGHLVPTFIKVMLIKDYNFFVPRSARVCQKHLFCKNWHLLPEMNNTISEFNVNNIEDMLNLAKRETSFDFENVNELPNHICHYWTGLNVFEFLTLYNELRLHINTLRKSSLAIYLIKLQTGDSNKRLSSLFKIPRATLERRMKEVKEYMMEHFVQLQTGFQRITPQDSANYNLSVPNT